MARSRNIKPAIMSNYQLAQLPPLTRILFIYLWMLADREGLLEDCQHRIGAQALPYDRDADVDGMLSELSRAGFISRYEFNSVKCIRINNFLKHQSPHGTEKDGELPDENGKLTIHERGKNGYATGVKRTVNSGLTVKQQGNNTLIPDSLIPDSLIPDSLIPDSKNTSRAKALSTPEGVSLVVWQDFLKHRKAKKAPVTETSLAGIRREAEKAGWSLESALRECCTRGWQSFKADWVDKQTSQAIDPESRQAVEADGVAKGIGKWNEAAEQWSVYKRRVRGPEYPKNIAALVSAGIQRTAA